MRNLAKKAANKPKKNLAEKNPAAISLLDSWLKGDEKEQTQTFEYLKKVLDEDRFSERKLFK